MYDAFISYRRKNGFLAAKVIRELLKSKGITAYMDLDELRNGTFDDKLLDAINACPSFVLILPPDALDRCAEEGDWLTKEIIAAVDAKKKIIPVLCDGFEWPKVWPENTPEKVKSIASYHGVEMSQYYVDAMIDKIVEQIQGESSSNSKSDLDTFFRNRMRDIDKVKGVDLAFHSGSTWHESIDRLDILEGLAEAGVKLRVLINSPETAESIGKHMRHKLKKYMPFSEAISVWKNFAEMYENVEVRVSDIPLLRIYYSFSMEDSERDAVRVKYYTYGNAKIESNFSQNFEPSDACYKLYKTEFEFLWNSAQ